MHACRSTLEDPTEESALRAQYWPWLPIAALVVGLAGSMLFWLWLAPKMDKKRGKQD